MKTRDIPSMLFSLANRGLGGSRGFRRATCSEETTILYVAGITSRGFVLAGLRGTALFSPR